MQESMQADLLPSAPEQPRLNPLVHGWFLPRETYRSVRAHYSMWQVLGLLLALSYVPTLLHPAVYGAVSMMFGLAKALPPTPAVMVAVIIGYVIFLLPFTWYVIPIAYRKGIRLMGGDASLDDVRVAMTTGSVPMLGNLFVGICAFVLFYTSKGYWIPQLEDMVPQQHWVLNYASLAQWVFIVWAQIAWSQSFAEAGKLPSAWDGFLSILIAILIIIGIALAIMLAIILLVAIGVIAAR